jgi:hypothetical protein
VVLQWLRANNCGWDGGVCMSAVEGSHLELLQWARAHGCQWGGGECYIAVCRYSRYPMSLTSLECQVSTLFNSDACPRPTTGRDRGPGDAAVAAGERARLAGATPSF